MVLRAGRAPDGVEVTRTGELVLVPDARTWKIDGYDLKVQRAPLAAPTTASPAPQVAP